MLKTHDPLTRWLWTHNPFYVISTLLMLYGVRAGYVSAEIGSINCWLMMGILAGYTLVLSALGVLLIRWGKVWDDARSILLLILLQFLAVSVSADDLFVKMESSSGGAALMAAGFGFSVAVLLETLRASGIKLGRVYVIPLTLFLALFFIAPWYCSPELHPKDWLSLDWTIFLFPQVAACLLLTLLPAVRQGARSIAGTGTPWPWPLFPWSAFVFIGVAVVFRSYALAMTFSPSGPIWAVPDSRSGIVFDTVWRPYFLVTFAAAILVLILEAATVHRHPMWARRVLVLAPALLVLAWPWSPTGASTGLLQSLTTMIGSPVWLTAWLLVLFYAWARFRRVRGAEFGLCCTVLLLGVIGPQTVSIDTLTPLNPIPFFAVSLTLAAIAFRRKSSVLALMSSVVATAAVPALLAGTPAEPFRFAICYHLLLGACLLISVMGRDRFAEQLQSVGATLLAFAALLTLNGSFTTQIPLEWRIGYVFGLCAVGLACALQTRSRVYWVCVIGITAAVGYLGSMVLYRRAVAVFGREAVAALCWSFGTLVIGFLISAHKARWLPRLGPVNATESQALATESAAQIDSSIDPPPNGEVQS